MSVQLRGLRHAIAATDSSRSTLYRAMDAGKLRWVQIGRRRKFTDDFLREYCGLPR